MIKSGTDSPTKRKILFVSHTANFSKFNRPYINWFKEQGYEVHYASMGEEKIAGCDKTFKINFRRSPFSTQNYSAYRQLKKLIDQQNYDLIHCHTPVGGVISRLAARKARLKGTKVVYTAHGFHFYKGAPLINWLLYFPTEKLLARYTDCLVTINEEDYQLAKKEFKARKIFKIDGVGVDLARFLPVSVVVKDRLRESYGYGHNSKILLCVAEFTKNKNQKFLIRSTKRLIKDFPDLKLILAGNGSELNNCKILAKKLGLNDVIDFVGYRTDIEKYYQISDVLVSASQREGLAVNLMEAMAAGLPVVCAKVRGQADVIKNNQNGYLYRLGDEPSFVRLTSKLLLTPSICHKMSNNNIDSVKKYSVARALSSMESIYNSIGINRSPIRVLQVVTIMNRAGLETMLMNYYRAIDRTKIQFDFLVHRDQKGDYNEEIKSLGGRIFYLPKLSFKNILSYCHQARLFFEEHRDDYRIIHSHLDALSAVPLYFARQVGIRTRIAHSHASGFDHNHKFIIRHLLRHFIKLVATDLAGCSIDAVKFIFGKRTTKYKIINNAFDVESYEYNYEARQSIRRELKLGDSFVIGHVGRFNYPKNHKYLIKIFCNLKKMDQNVKLLLVGTGKLEAKIKTLADRLGIGSDIIFLGNRSDVSRLLSAMDIFVLPSRYEGLGIALVEAQASGLICLASDVVPKTAKITSRLYFLSLKQNPVDWAEKIMSYRDSCKNRLVDKEALLSSGYDISIEAKRLSDYY